MREQDGVLWGIAPETMLVNMRALNVRDNTQTFLVFARSTVPRRTKPVEGIPRR